MYIEPADTLHFIVDHITLSANSDIHSNRFRFSFNSNSFIFVAIAQKSPIVLVGLKKWHEEKQS